MRFIKRGVLVVVLMGAAFFVHAPRSCAQNCPLGDVDRNGVVNLADFEYFRRLFKAGGVLPTSPPQGGTIPANAKIMPLGDSITMGMHGLGADWNVNKSLRGGYRGKLYDLLKANGTTFNFVGSGPLDPRETFPDQEHEGHGGWCITGGGGSCYADGIDPQAAGNGGLAHHLNGWLSQHQPDVVLLHVGTNDFNGGDPVNDVLSRYGQLLDQIWAARPNAWIFATAINIVGRSDVNVTFNQQLQQLMQQKSATGKKSFYVNTYQGMVEPIGSEGDTLHPSLANYEIMGTNWFNALKPHLGGGGGNPNPPPGGINPVGQTGSFTLTFQDEFDSFDSSKWTRTYPWDTSSNERRDTDAGSGQIINPANVQVSGGILKLLYKKIPPETINGITREWEGAIMHTRGKKDFASDPRGAYMEIRTKAVRGSGLWSASWLLPIDFANDTNCPVQRYTLKVFEVNGKYPPYNNFNVKKRGSCTVGDPNNLIDDLKTYQHTQDLANDFHTYGMDWYPDHIDFYFDGQKVHSSTAINGIDMPGFLILNAYVVTDVGLNGKNFFPFDGVPNAQTPQATEYQYDYIRTWRRN